MAGAHTSGRRLVTSWRGGLPALFALSAGTFARSFQVFGSEARWRRAKDGCTLVSANVAGRIKTQVIARPAGYEFGPLYAVDAVAPHDATVIWLHGLGDTGEGWADVGPQLQQRLPSVRFLFPTAAEQPVTVNGGMWMPSWFDINSLNPNNFQLNPPGLKQSARYVLALVEEEVKKGVPPDRVVLAGFSQGGAVVLEAALKGEVKTVLVLSSFLGSRWPRQLEDPPEVHFFHGEADPVVPIDWGMRSLKKLKASGVKVSFTSYEGMQHSACAQARRHRSRPELCAGLTGGRAGAYPVLSMLEAIDGNRLVNAQSLTRLFRWEATRPIGTDLIGSRWGAWLRAASKSQGSRRQFVPEGMGEGGKFLDKVGVTVAFPVAMGTEYWLETGFLLTSMALNVGLLTPVCVGLYFNMPLMTEWYGEPTIARGILLSVYLSIVVASGALFSLVFVDLAHQVARILIAGLLAMQIFYKFLSPFTTERAKDRVASMAVACQLGLAMFHGITLGVRCSSCSPPSTSLIDARLRWKKSRWPIEISSRDMQTQGSKSAFLAAGLKYSSAFEVPSRA
ncbi:unnamed protein product [Effrenium voratum]|nr:unnamed protein product [Effrenium voratum]